MSFACMYVPTRQGMIGRYPIMWDTVSDIASSSSVKLSTTS